MDGLRHLRLTSITVKGLFDLFGEYHIPLNVDEGITIIYGLNGSGKSTIIRLLESIYRRNFQQLWITPFSEIVLEYDDGSSLFFGQRRTIGQVDSGDPYVIFRKPGEHENETEHLLENLGYLEDTLDSVVENLASNEEIETNTEEVAAELYRDIPLFLSGGDASISVSQLLNHMKEDTAGFVQSEEAHRRTLAAMVVQLLTYVALLHRTRSSLLTIDTDRFTTSGRSPWIGHPGSQDRELSDKAAVEVYAQELAELVHGQQEQSRGVSRRLETTFPARVVQRLFQHQERLSSDSALSELDQSFKRLATMTRRYSNVGFVSELESVESPIESALWNTPGTTDDVKLSLAAILSVFVEDKLLQLAPFQEPEQTLALFQELLNRCLLKKTISINGASGISVTLANDRALSVASLSSGEQHLLALYYLLLFRATDETLVLIDEPELSLHVAWQAGLIDDIKKMAKVVGFNIIIATHSPDIIGDHYDLAVELKDSDSQ